jgi:hypothetical protein
VTDDILSRYVVFLSRGHTLQNKMVLAGTIKGYLRVVNKHYKELRLLEPFDSNNAASRAATLVNELEKFEKEPARRAPLPDQVIARMAELAEESPQTGFRATAWDITDMGRFGGFRQQEYAMDSRTEIKFYVLPNGARVARAFTVSNFIFLDKQGQRVKEPLLDEGNILDVGTQFDVQKNRVNGQVMYFRREDDFPRYCPVRAGLRLLWRARTLGQGPNDPICVYLSEDKEKFFLTGKDMTEYYRFVFRLVFPDSSEEVWKLISTHSIRVTACVLLAEAGKDGWYIKLRLRWLSNCYEIYLRNTDRIISQHNEAIAIANRRLNEIAITPANLPDVLADASMHNIDTYELEDED